MIQPGTLALVFVATGLTGVVTYSLTKMAETKMGDLEPEDWLPAAPPDLPIPRFLVEDPDYISDAAEEM